MKLIAADIGNSTISIGIMKGRSIDVYKMLTRPVLQPADYIKKLTSLLDMSRIPGVDDSVLCTVVPEAAAPLAEALGQLCGRETLIVTPGSDAGMVLDIEEPSSLGADRLASAAGALTLADPPIAIVDFGTATTVNFIDPAPDGAPIYRGGTIMPGMALMAQSLEANTAQLPRISYGRMPRLPGRNTEDNILAGVAYATAGGVERIIAEVEAATGLEYTVMATGGMMEHAAPLLKRPCKPHPALTLRGLMRIYQLNHGA